MRSEDLNPLNARGVLHSTEESPGPNTGNKIGQHLRVNSDKVQNVGQGKNLDHLRTNMLHWDEYEGNLFFQVLAFFGPYLK